MFITWVFWLSGSAALSNAVGGGSCYNTRDCGSLKAIVAFGWIAWIELTFLLGVICYLGVKAFRGGRGVQESLA